MGLAGDDPSMAAPADAFVDDPAFEASERLWRALASIGGLIAAVVLIALVFIVAHSNRARDAALARERHSYEVMLVTGALGEALAATEAQLGHFVVNGDRIVGSAVSDRWALAGSLIDRLDEMTADNPSQHHLVEQLHALYGRRGKEFGDPAVRAYFKQGNPALNLFNAASKTPTGPRIALLLRRLTANERALLGQRAAQAEASVTHSNQMAELLSVIGIVMVLGVALLGATAFQATAQRHIARRNLRKANERADTLEARVAERTLDLARANEALRAEAAERAAAEAQLRQVQKMEAVGQLTGGIAHDFNNMLAVVVGGLDLARQRLTAETAEVARHIDNAMEGANRAAALTRRLLAFARAEPLLPESIDPARLLHGMSDLLDRTIGERIEVEVVTPPALWKVWVDRHQLENAILNLAVNSRDAMEGGGVLRIEAANVSLAHHAIGEAPAGDYVRIAVIDSGAGIPDMIVDRVLEPFFTTKPVGKGTGLGLSQTFGFVRQTGGEMVIDSVAGLGTTVALYLPRWSSSASAPGPHTVIAPKTSPSIQAELKNSGLTILVVEDDPRVRRATVDALVALGHDPLPCSSGEDAIAVLEERYDIAMMITDVVMPGMTGPDLVERIAPRRPELAILFVTGYVGEAGEADQLRGYEILRKPFTMATLGTAIAAAAMRTANGRRRVSGVVVAT